MGQIRIETCVSRKSKTAANQVRMFHWYVPVKGPAHLGLNPQLHDNFSTIIVFSDRNDPPTIFANAEYLRQSPDKMASE